MARILAVDDDPVFSVLLQHLLMSEGHIPIVVSSASAALAALAADSEIDVLLTDLAMPGVSGIDLIKTLRGAYPSLPIIALSSGGNIAGVDLFEEAKRLLGADWVTPKAGCTVVLGVLLQRIIDQIVSPLFVSTRQALA